MRKVKIKGCVNCKHFKRDISNVECRECIKTRRYTKWVPSNPIHWLMRVIKKEMKG